MSRVRVILDCDEEHIAFAADLAISALPDIRDRELGQ